MDKWWIICVPAADVLLGLYCLIFYPHCWLRQPTAWIWVAAACQKVFIAVISPGIIGDRPVYQSTNRAELHFFQGLRPCNYWTWLGCWRRQEQMFSSLFMLTNFRSVLQRMVLRLLNQYSFTDALLLYVLKASEPFHLEFPRKTVWGSYLPLLR